MEKSSEKEMIGSIDIQYCQRRDPCLILEASAMCSKY